MTNVGSYTTRIPHTIGFGQPLAVARRIMSEHSVRYLPVLHDGRFVGVLSDREIESLEVLPGSRHLTVEDVMAPNVYVASENERLGHVAEEMVLRQLASAVVVAGSDPTKAIGVFTAVDALRALADALRSARSGTGGVSRDLSVTLPPAVGG